MRKDTVNETGSGLHNCIIQRWKETGSGLHNCIIQRCVFKIICNYASLTSFHKSNAMVNYLLGDNAKQIFASTYQFHLPSEKELEVELIRELTNLNSQ
jgi:capsular polysaccharide biosynthesis protein